MSSKAPLVLLSQPASRITCIKLNRPSKLNALDESMQQQLISAYASIPRGHALILTGAGRGFSAGGDLGFLSGLTREPFADIVAALHSFYDRVLAVRKLQHPVIIAANGTAIGAGACLAVASDFRIGPAAVPSARFGFNFGSLGFAPGIGSSHLLPQLVGPAKARAMLSLDRTLDPQEALAAGLVDSLAEDPVDAAIALADELLASHRNFDSVMAGIDAMRRFQNTGLAAALDAEALAQAGAISSPAMREGIAAILEKRQPNFAR